MTKQFKKDLFYLLDISKSFLKKLEFDIANRMVNYKLVYFNAKGRAEVKFRLFKKLKFTQSVCLNILTLRGIYL